MVAPVGGSSTTTTLQPTSTTTDSTSTSSTSGSTKTAKNSPTTDAFTRHSGDEIPMYSNQLSTSTVRHSGDEIPMNCSTGGVECFSLAETDFSAL